MRRHTCFVLVFITATFPVYVLGYPNGQVSSACADMMPRHGANAQTSAAPYTITASNSTFNPGDTISVTLKSQSGVNFKGFLLETRAAGSSPAVPLGTFNTINSQAQLLNCNIDGSAHVNSAVSHNSATEKTEITVTWIAPDTDNIEFRATVVQNFGTFWTEVKSRTIQRNVTSVSPTTATTLSTATQQGISSTSSSDTTQFSSDGCGIRKFCFSNPAECNPARDPNCFFMSSVSVGNQGLRFEMSGKANGYISLGFSDDKIMGNDDIYICVLDSAGKIQVQRAYSTGRSRPLTEPLGEVDSITVANKNGVIQCSFVTRNNISTAQRAANNMYYLFFAYGPAFNGEIRKHQVTPFISTEKLDVSVIQSAGGSNNKPIIIKTHGALMLIAWMTTGSIGMIIAKFFKSIGGTKKILGKNIWFQLHWSLMVLTVAVTITGFVLAFVQVKGWSYNAGAHPVLGCIVMGLALIQPTVAICRPSPDHNRRHLFNWFHTFMALVIKCLAVATLFLGFQLINVAPNRWPVKVMGGFVAWEALANIMLFVYWYSKEMALYSTLKKKVEPEMLILIVYLCGNLAFLIALLVGIGQT
ncbi:putative ferric-chelate reductase 1 [Heptranchias perlo]|uniref:putative ferric-chelate reductase 1 n=1 Tax=Heptranchias perlo TaxID=212740 RepID=UPI00355A48F2